MRVVGGHCLTFAHPCVSIDLHQPYPSISLQLPDNHSKLVILYHTNPMTKDILTLAILGQHTATCCGSPCPTCTQNSVHSGWKYKKVTKEDSWNLGKARHTPWLRHVNYVVVFYMSYGVSHTLAAATA